MSSAEKTELLRHPRIERRSLVAWPGYHSGLSVGSFDRRIVGTIAKPLAHAVQDGTLVSEALDAGMGVALPTQTWCNQLPVEHPRRGGGFADLRIHRSGAVYDPDQAPLKGKQAEAYASDDQEAQVAAEATLILTAAHVLTHECAGGRDSELLLAQLAAEEFLAARRRQPAPGRTGTRELFVTVIVQGDHAANTHIIERLVAMYAALENVDGYWIVAVNTNRSAKQLRGYARLALRLQAATGRPAVLSRIGDEHLAAIASGVAATCAGVHGMSFQFPPYVMPEPEDDEDEAGIGIYTYHRVPLGNAGRLGVEGDALRARLFKKFGCPCGHHKAHVPPFGKRQIVAHNLWAVSTDALAFAASSAVSAEAALELRVVTARHQRAALEMSPLRPGFWHIRQEAELLRASSSGESQAG